jgi:lysyl-tRNA synthetase class 2
MIQAVRDFFTAAGYLEIETPQLCPTAIPEAHIDPVKAGKLYLQASPEMCMKRLLAAGYDKIFQISRCFRNGERGERHLPEFTMLEWYRRGGDYLGLMDECEALFEMVAEAMGRGKTVFYAGRRIDLKAPWEKMTVEKAFQLFAPLTMRAALQRDAFDEILVQYIEPRLGLQKPTILYDYPAGRAGLARLRTDNPQLAERFEIFAGGLELANGFSELTDPKEQKERFRSDLKARRAAEKELPPLPEKLLAALQKLSETAGIALGIDRLAMLFTDSSRIDQVVPFTPEDL